MLTLETRRNSETSSRNLRKKVKKAAKSSPEVRALIVPLAKLEKAVRIGAWGIVFVPEDK